MESLIIGNWKCHKSVDEGRRWLDSFASLYRPQEGLQVAVAPTFLCLEPLARHLQQLSLPNFSLAAQDVSPFPPGSYTGAIAASMLRGLVDLVIVGHSERRRWFREDQQGVANKAAEVIDAGLRPIVCVDDSNLRSQLLALHELDGKTPLVAYTPVDALNFSIPQSPELITAAISEVHGLFRNWPVVYGGAVRGEDVERYRRINNLSGLFVGRASLEAAEFAKLCNSW